MLILFNVHMLIVVLSAYCMHVSNLQDFSGTLPLTVEITAVAFLL